MPPSYGTVQLYNCHYSSLFTLNYSPRKIFKKNFNKSMENICVCGNYFVTLRWDKTEVFKHRKGPFLCWSFAQISPRVLAAPRQFKRARLLSVCTTLVSGRRKKAASKREQSQNAFDYAERKQARGESLKARALCAQGLSLLMEALNLIY